ncbi:hypothetical protein N6H18_05055 [Reichenbachiella agarivorans]|uniref:DUF6984 domain-containing protein n=1 Tax=Reichenbachiella agarivorans TaxID=2979464 RepID=A0ABY6CS61_9BACT|nr:hypothetical protein [Reichenbachiella agarivorans]UXP33318.1 hypothetical protein N6H18_05055 [Reichenbachiella agarivorans]
MSISREIKAEERAIVLAMLEQSGLNATDFPMSEQVAAYGQPYMGSINFDNDRPDLYDGDIAQCEYLDADGMRVVLSLTKDQEGKLLDLDIWKENFTALVAYPTPETLIFKKKEEDR